MPKQKRQAKRRYRMIAWHWTNPGQLKKEYYSLQSSDEEAREWFRSRLKIDSGIHEALLEAVKGNREVTVYIGYV